MRPNTLVWIVLSLLLTLPGCKEDDSTTITMDSMNPAEDMGRTVRPDVTVVDAQVLNTDAMQPPDSCVECSDMSQDAVPSITVELLSPVNGTTLPLGATVVFAGRVVSRNVDPAFVSSRIEIDGRIDLPILPDQNGFFEVTAPDLTPGAHTATLTARLFPEIVKSVSVEFNLDCTYLETFDEALPTDTWTVYGEHASVENAWLELTGNQISTASAMVLTGFPIRPNALDIEFDLSIGKCAVPGPCNIDRDQSADGVAVSIWAITPDSFEDIWYSRWQHFLVKETRLTEVGLTRPDSFHVEFDSFSNHCHGCGTVSDYEGCQNGHIDPSPNNHIELHFNGHADPRGEPDPASNFYCDWGDPTDEYGGYWAEFLELDNNEWHHVRIRINGLRVQVWMNETALTDTPIIEAEIPGLSFKGGLLSLSGGTGSLGSNHRIDNLQINAACN
jgi:hypothetical protein